ncbi:MAG: DMT family transporter [Alphaproteobacteria bacterium]|nr:DMT family transporter [Alphaproteobacteria bacterium]
MINRVGWGIGFALAAASLYGFVPNLVRAAFNNGVPPVESTLLRTAAVAVIFTILAVARGEKLSIPRAALPSFFGQCIATLIISVGYLASVQFIPVGLAVIIFFSFPVLIMLAAPLFEGHAPGRGRVAVALFAFAGLAVAVGPGIESLDIRGIVLASLASFACVLQFFSGRKISFYLTPTVFGGLVHVAILPAAFLIALFAGSGRIQMFPGGSASHLGLSFAIGIALLYVCAYLIHMLSLRFAPASTVAPYYNLEPIMTTAVAALFLGERLSINQYIGGGMVLAALLVSSLVGKGKVTQDA